MRILPAFYAVAAVELVERDPLVHKAAGAERERTSPDRLVGRKTLAQQLLGRRRLDWREQVIADRRVAIGATAAVSADAVARRHLPRFEQALFAELLGSRIEMPPSSDVSCVTASFCSAGPSCDW